MANYPSLTISFKSFMELPPAYETIRTPFEAGYVQTRNKSTTAPRQYEFVHEAASASEVSTFVTFWNARKGGAEAFTFTDPRTSSQISCRFVGDPPDITPVGGGNVGFNIGPVRLEEAL